jgi:hypothetical protein
MLFRRGNGRRGGTKHKVRQVLSRMPADHGSSPLMVSEAHNQLWHKACVAPQQSLPMLGKAGPDSGSVHYEAGEGGRRHSPFVPSDLSALLTISISFVSTPPE